MIGDSFYKILRRRWTSTLKWTTTTLRSIVRRYLITTTMNHLNVRPLELRIVVGQGIIKKVHHLLCRAAQRVLIKMGHPCRSFAKCKKKLQMLFCPPPPPTAALLEVVVGAVVPHNRSMVVSKIAPLPHPCWRATHLNSGGILVHTVMERLWRLMEVLTRASLRVRWSFEDLKKKIDFFGGIPKGWDFSKKHFFCFLGFFVFSNRYVSAVFFYLWKFFF